MKRSWDQSKLDKQEFGLACNQAGARRMSGEYTYHYCVFFLLCRVVFVSLSVCFCAVLVIVSQMVPGWMLNMDFTASVL